MNDQTTKHTYTVDVYKPYDKRETREHSWNWIRGIPMPDPFTAAVYAAIMRRQGWTRVLVRASFALVAFLAITTTPAGCELSGHTSEGFPVATCENGTTIYRDMDGAGGYNSGLPYVTPGTWVEFG